MSIWKRLSQRKFAVIVAVLICAAGALAFYSTGQKNKPLVAAPSDPMITKALVAGPGLVEPGSEDVQVGSELAGKLRQVLAEEGDHVRKGQILAALVNDDYRANLEASRAGAEQAQATYEKVLNGARPQERGQFLAERRKAEILDADARSDHERARRLFASGVISREAMDHADRDLNVAEEKLESASQQFHLIDDRSRAEDITAAKAQLDAARAQLDSSEAIYAKTFLRAPFDGTILRKHHRAGESITNSSVTPDPVFTVGDVSNIRVRVDVDETDVSRVFEGQSVFVTAQAYPGQKFWGHVIRIAGQLGHKNLHTDEPKEKVDAKILETLVQMDPGTNLPVGLRVDAHIQTELK